MGSAESVPSTPPPPYRAVARRRDQVSMTLDEKFDAFRIDHNEDVPDKKVLSSDGGEDIDAAKTQDYVYQLLKEPKNQLGLAAFSANNPRAVLERQSAILRDTQTFNVTIPFEGSPVTNQRSSGRCWIFAATNVFRVAIQQKYDIKEFELSQAYLFFWDKVEKANYFLESILETADEPIDSRLVSALNSDPLSDGGQWDMIVSLVLKYGIVPQTLYPDSWNAKSSGVMDVLLTTKLRESGLLLRSLKSSPTTTSTHLSTAKEAALQDIIRILTLCLGPPPPSTSKFTWQFYDSKHQYKSVHLTPLEFASTTHVQRFVSLVNDPRNEYSRLLTVSNLGNVWNGRAVTYINVPQQVLKDACVAMLKRGLPVFFGSDVGQQSDSSKGIMDAELIDYELGFDVKLGLKKGERLMTGESAMTHAMCLTGVHVDGKGKSVRWRVMNSWSESAGTDGYFVMTDRWMDEFVYQAVIDPVVLDKEIRDVLKQKPKVLPLWDPMGALA